MMGFSLSNRRHLAGLIVALALIVLPFLNTESGWLTSYEWYVNELHEGDEMFAEVWETTIDELAEQGDLDEDDVEEANKFAEKLGIDAVWTD